jgi:hypothetical protein
MSQKIKKEHVRNIRFLIEDDTTVKIWKPDTIEMHDFRGQCGYIVKYLIDEGFLKSTKCKVNVVI